MINAGEGVEDLETVLHLLPAPAVTEVHKAMNLPRKKAGGGNNRADCIQSLLRHAKTKNPFAVAAGKGGGVEQAILKK